MPRYMLDTDTVSFALRGQGRVAARLLEHRPSDLCISSITLAELRYGAEARRSRKLHRLISTFVEAIEVVSFDRSAAGRFARVAAALARRGEPIGTFDTLIAAHALSLRLTFVTNNTQHFARVVGLATENWLGFRGPPNSRLERTGYAGRSAGSFGEGEVTYALPVRPGPPACGSWQRFAEIARSERIASA